MNLTAHQQTAFNAIQRAIANHTPVFTLHGLAGTGKTTVLGEVAKSNPDAWMCTLTGKAASVLSGKTGVDTQTIHQAFYNLTGKGKDERGRKQLFWKGKHEGDALNHKTILLDECSMVDEAMASEILRTGASIIACGDPGQLPPVRGKQFFSDADCTLNEIHRQSQDSPIIRQAYAVRNQGIYEPDGPDFRVQRRGTEEDMLSADIVLCWTNKTRDRANQRLRSMKGIWSASPQIGEPVICLKNNRDFGLFNGAIYTLAAPFYDWDTQITIEIAGGPVTIKNTVFRGVQSRLDPDDECDGYFDFGYAVTVHKSQGSEWDNVVLIDEYPPNRCDRRQWLYTGITRAKRRMLVLGGNNGR